MSRTTMNGGAGPAVLDIGPGAGGLLIHASIAMRDAEIEVVSVTEPERRTHVGVLQRFLGGATGWVAVFSGLIPGGYTVRAGGPLRTAVVTVRAGEVAELDWR